VTQGARFGLQLSRNCRCPGTVPELVASSLLP